ncbi:MAG: amidohydrolase family protein [Vulcanisaeta sp. AZ3]|jgi:hypothetical protein|nr:MAG: amidohydrolase [Vulcanisaeta sp. AZ3]
MVETYYFIDFHVHPGAELHKLRSKLEGVGAVASVLYPIDVDTTLSLTLNNLFKIAKDLGKSVNVGLTIREINNLISKWPEYMIDNMKLWYEVFKEGTGDFFIPFSSINPSFGIKYVKQKIWELNHLGLRGVFVSPILQFFNPARSQAFIELMEYSERNNILMIMHLGMPDDLDDILITHIIPNNLAEILAEFRPNIVISGLGTSQSRLGLWIRNVVRVMKKYDNVYLTTPDINCYLFNNESGWSIINSIGTDRILFGSGYPYRRYRDLLSDVKCVEGSEAIHSIDKEKIMFYNAIDLLKIHEFRIIDYLST